MLGHLTSSDMAGVVAIGNNQGLCTTSLLSKTRFENDD